MCWPAASKAGARYAVFAGAAEREEGVLALKDLRTGEQDKAPPEGLPDRVKSRDD